MTWIKQGCIFNLKSNPCRTTHAQVPTPYIMEDRIRIYYACRDTHNQSYPAYFDLLKDLKTILDVHETSVMERGKPGMFDSDGIMPSCVIKQDDELWMYYIGWSELKNTARYQNEIGISISKDNGKSFERIFEGPIMGRSMNEPGLAVMPFVRQEESGLFSMWYQSGTGWHEIGGEYEPTYVIKYASSHNGTIWIRNPEVCVEPFYKLQAFSRPWVEKFDGFDSMWYCIRGSADYRGGDGSYRIECADALDKTHFMRSQDKKLFKGATGEFDSHMQCYPSICEVDGKKIMFYNGNDFGQTGIGLAIWE